MAKVTPPQNIPSELLDDYRAALGEKRPDHGVRKRYPYHVPTMQSEVGRPSTKQKTQRAKFDLAISRFNATPWADRQRWYDAMPPWGSFLWYYDYFILSALMYDSNIPQGGAGVIKLIQIMKASCPTTGGHTFTLPTEVVGAKTVVMMFGSARKVPRVLRGSGSVATGGSTLALGATVDPDKCTITLNGNSDIEEAFNGAAYARLVMPYVFSLTTTQITIKWSFTPDAAANVGWEVTEHVEGAVWPVLVSISNTEVAVDWAEEPDAAADVSIIAIEYI